MLRLVQESEFTVIAHVDHRLGLASEETALEKRTVEGIDHGGCLQVVALLKRRQKRNEQHVALERAAGLENARAASPPEAGQRFSEGSHRPPGFRRA